MGVSGTWLQRASHDYTGATKWGDGYNPIHGVRDNGRGRVIGTRENLLPLGEPSDVVNESITSRDIDFIVEDYVEYTMPGEYYRYQEDFPRWNQTTPQFRDATNNTAMGEQPPWGVYFDTNPIDGFPLAGPTGGMQRWLDVNHGEVEEQNTPIAVPTAPVTGGWKSKQRGANAVAESQEVKQEGFQWTLNNASVQGQGLLSLSNERAVARGTDTPRSSIVSRTAGMAEKDYAKSFGMGGGAGTPDMYPFQQTAGLKRPWLTRVTATPPAEDHFMNTMEGRSPLFRVMPQDPYQGDYEAGDGDTGSGEWGY